MIPEALKGNRIATPENDPKAGVRERYQDRHYPPLHSRRL